MREEPPCDAERPFEDLWGKVRGEELGGWTKENLLKKLTPTGVKN